MNRPMGFFLYFLSWVRTSSANRVSCRRCTPHVTPRVDRRSLDDQRRLEDYGSRNVVEIGRCRHDRLVDLGELLFCAVTLDANRIAEVLVTRRHGRIDPEEATKIDLAVGLDRQAFEGDSAHRALRHISH